MASRFITIEGGEGAGKTTLQRRLVSTLEARGFEVVATREPGGVPMSEKIRALLLDPEFEVGPTAESLLFLAARAEHLRQVVRPALSLGKWVVCDRFSDSTKAYQGYGRERDVERLIALCDWVDREVKPKVTFWIDLDPLEGLARAQRVTNGRDRMEEAEIAFHDRVHRGFRALAEREPRRIVRLDGKLSQEELFEAAWSVIEDRLL